MKKSVLLLVAFTLFSCKKEAAVENNNRDSVQITQDSARVESMSVKKDSAAVQTASSELSREEKGRVIIRVADGEKLPFTIDENFTQEHDKLILRIVNFEKTKLTGSIVPVENEMNVRFNQIKLPNGKMDGPFSRQISYDISESGEVILVIGKNNMADGKIEGQFSVTID